MALVKWWDPFEEFDFPSIRSRDLAIDMYEEGSNLIAKANLPGIDPEKIDISIENHLLRITGSREEKTEKKEKDYYYKEIKCGSFERCITLPYTVQADKTTAEYIKGVLKITMPKKKEAAAGKIKVSIKK